MQQKVTRGKMRLQSDSLSEGTCFALHLDQRCISKIQLDIIKLKASSGRAVVATVVALY